MSRTTAIFKSKAPPPSVERLFELVKKSGAPIRACGPFYHAEPTVISSFDFPKRKLNDTRIVLLVHTNRETDTIKTAFIQLDMIGFMRNVGKPAIALTYLLHHGKGKNLKRIA